MESFKDSFVPLKRVVVSVRVGTGQWTGKGQVGIWRGRQVKMFCVVGTWLSIMAKTHQIEHL
jgi:hypothetical protein